MRTELVKFAANGKVKTRVADRQFRDVILANRFVATLKKTGDPKIEIYLADENGRKLSGKDNFIMQIRYKLEVQSNPKKTQYKFYPRNYLEAQQGMFLL